MAKDTPVGVMTYKELVDQFPALSAKDPAELAGLLHKRDAPQMDRAEFDRQFFTNSQFAPEETAPKHPTEKFIEENPAVAGMPFIELNEYMATTTGKKYDLKKDYGMYGDLPESAFISEVSDIDWDQAGQTAIRFSEHFAIGANRSIASFEGTLAKAIGWALPDGWVFSDEALNASVERLLENAELIEMDLNKRGRGGFFTEAIGEGIGSAPAGITEFMLDIPWAMVQGAIAGAQTLKHDEEMYKQYAHMFSSIIKHGYERAVVGKIFKGLHPLKRHIKAPSMGTIFALQGMLHGERDPRELGKAFTMGMLFGLMEPDQGQIGLDNIRAKADEYFKASVAERAMMEKETRALVEKLNDETLLEPQGRDELLDVKDPVDVNALLKEKMESYTDLDDYQSFRKAVKEATVEGHDVTDRDIVGLLDMEASSQFMDPVAVDMMDTKLEKQGVVIVFEDMDFFEGGTRDTPIDTDLDISEMTQSVKDLADAEIGTQFKVAKLGGQEQVDFSITGEVVEYADGVKGIYVEGMYNTSPKSETASLLLLTRLQNWFGIRVTQAPRAGRTPEWHPDFDQERGVPKPFPIRQQNLVTRYSKAGFRATSDSETKGELGPYEVAELQEMNKKIKVVKFIREAVESGATDPAEVRAKYEESDINIPDVDGARMERFARNFADIEADYPGEIRYNADKADYDKSYTLQEIIENWPFLYEGEMLKDPTGTPHSAILAEVSEIVAKNTPQPVERTLAAERNRSAAIEEQTAHLLEQVERIGGLREETGAEPIGTLEGDPTDINIDIFLGPEEARVMIESAAKYDPEGTLRETGGVEPQTETARGAVEKANEVLYKAGEEAADLFGESLAHLKETKGNWDGLAKQFIAAKIIMGRLSNAMTTMAQELVALRAEGKDDNLLKLKFMDRLDMFNEVQSLVKGQQTNIARALNAGKIYVKEGWVRLDQIDGKTFADSKAGRDLEQKLQRPDAAEIDRIIDQFAKVQDVRGAMTASRKLDSKHPIVDALVEFRLASMLGSISTQAVNTTTAVAHSLWQAFVEAPAAMAYGRVAYGKESPITLREVGVRQYYTVMGLMNEFITKPLWIMGKEGKNEAARFGANPKKYIKEAPGRAEMAIDEARPDTFSRTEVERMADKAISAEKLKKSKVVSAAGKVTRKLSEQFLPKSIQGKGSEQAWGMVDFVGSLNRLQGFGWMGLSDNGVKRVAINAEVAALAYREAVRQGKNPKDARTYADTMVELTRRYRNEEDLSDLSPDAFALVQDLNESGVRNGKYVTFMEKLTNSRTNGLAHFFSGPVAKLSIVPFFVTPANLIKWSFERVPVPGYDPESSMKLTLKGLGDIREQSNSSDPAVRAEAFGKVAGGSLLLAMSLGLVYGTNRVTPEIQPEDRKRLVENLRILPSGIEFPDGTTYQFNRSDPFGMYLSLVTQMNYLSQIAMTKDLGPNVDDDEFAQRLADVGIALVVGTGNQLISRSFFQGFADLTEAMNSPERRAKQLLDNWASSFLPAGGLVKSVTERVDPQLREAYTLMEKIQKVYFPQGIGNLEALPPKRDMFGKEVTDYGRTAGLMTMKRETGQSPVRDWMNALNINIKENRDLLPNIPTDYEDIRAIKLILQDMDAEGEINKMISRSPTFDQDNPSTNATKQAITLQRYISGYWRKAAHEYTKQNPAFKAALKEYYDEMKKQPGINPNSLADIAEVVLGNRGIRRVR